MCGIWISNDLWLQLICCTSTCHIDHIFWRSYLGSWEMIISHTYLNTSNLSDYIMDNAYLAPNPLQTSVKESIFLLSLLILFQYRSIWFNFMSDHSITDHMALYDLHRTPNSISEDFSIL